MSLSRNAKERIVIALTSRPVGAEVAAKMDQASHVVIAMSVSATISTDAAFAAKLKIGDRVVSHKAASNESANVAADGTLPAGITDAAGTTLAYRAAL